MLQKRQLGTQQPDPDRTAVAADAHLDVAGHVAQQDERLAVGGDVGQPALGGEHGAPLAVAHRRRLGPGDLADRRVGHHQPGIGVDEQRRVVGQVEHPRIDAGDQRQPDRTRHDRGVRVGAPAHGDRADQPQTEVLEQVGGADFVADQYEPAGVRRRAHACTVARDPFQNPAPDLAYVGGPFAQCLVGQRVEHGGVAFDRVVDGPQRVGCGRRLPGGLDKLRVAGDERADRHDVGGRAPALRAGPLGEPFQVECDRGERLCHVVGVDGCGSDVHRPVHPPRRGDGGTRGHARARPPERRGGHGAASATALARARRMRTVEAAPGSSCPIVRGPR